MKNLPFYISVERITTMAIILIGGVLVHEAKCNNYYFSSVNGNDSHAVSSYENPWKSISKLRSLSGSLNAGDMIFLERGSEWDMTRLSYTGLNGSNGAYITFQAYGEGPLPVFSGKKTLQSMSQSGNVWSVTDYDFTDDRSTRVIPGVFINYKWYPVSRTPNEGYYVTNTTGSKVYLEDYGQNWANNSFSGATVVARTEAWQWDKAIVSGNGSGSMNFWSPGFMYELKYYTTHYFIQNHVTCLDQDGEWAYDYGSNKLSVYFSGNLNNQKVQFTTTDTLITLRQCSYVKFENIHFTGANIYAIFIYGGSDVVVNNCKFDYIGKASLKASYSDKTYFTNNEVYQIHRNGMMFNNNGTTYITGNRIDSIGVIPGHETGSEFANQAISYYKQKGDIHISKNHISNVVYGICGFENEAPVYITKNLIENYGLQLGDGGAYYNAHDSFPVNKYIINNIAINGTGDPATNYDHQGLIHAYYHDYDCKYFTVDSNSAYYTNQALFINKTLNCKFRYNNIYRIGQKMNKDWRYAMYQDNHIGVTYIDRNEIKHNQIVLDDLDFQYVYAVHDLFDKRNNNYDYNTYIAPFSTREDFIRKVSYWTPGQTYTIPQWYGYIGHEQHSVLSDIKYSESLGIPKEDFVKFLYNFSDTEELRSLDGIYTDKDGTIYEGSVSIPPYYSVILFFKDTLDQAANNKPVVSNMEIVVNETDPLPLFIDSIQASDPDAGQTLTWTILSGNESGLFSVTDEGALNFTSSTIDFTGDPDYSLTVQVADNGIPIKTDQATVLISLLQAETPLPEESQPPVLNSQSFNTSYDTALPALLGTVETSEADLSRDLLFEIISGNQDNLFALDSTTGAISMVKYPAGNETLSVIFGIKVSDNADLALFSEANITVNIQASDVPAPEEPQPPDLNPQTFNTDFDAVLPAQLGTIERSEADINRNLRFEIVTGNPDHLFALDASTGALSYVKYPAGNEALSVILGIKVSDEAAPLIFSETSITVNIQATGEAEPEEPQPPVLKPQSFNTSYDVALPAQLGIIEKAEADLNRELSFQIVSGNHDNIFSLDANTGTLSMVDYPASNESLSFIMRIKVSDALKSTLSSETNITVYIQPSDNVYYINPDNTEDEKEDGSFNHPYSTWSKVSWEEGASYLQKRGTKATEEKILVLAGNVILGDYGSGEAPVIQSNASDYALKVIDKANVTVKNITFTADKAIGCIYFIGPDCDNNKVENCKLNGAEYGIRIIDGKSYTVKYNVFNNKVDGIYSIAEYAEIYYNVFRDNHTAINLSSYSTSAKIYNNVFYGNYQGISTSYAEVLLFNNIFYLLNPGDQAINHKLDKIVSDNNIFYPEQDGFIEIEEVRYGTLEDYQRDYGFDINSFAKDPMFVDVYNSNFSVDAYSRAIDAGRAVGLKHDFFGQSVPLGGAPDIGLAEAEGYGLLSTEFNEMGDAELKIYPNPSSGRFNLSFSEETAEPTRIVVSSLSGHKIHEEEYQFTGVLRTEIDLSGYPVGIYFLTIEANDKSFSQKLVIE